MEGNFSFVSNLRKLQKCLNAISRCLFIRMISSIWNNNFKIVNLFDKCMRSLILIGINSFDIIRTRIKSIIIYNDNNIKFQIFQINLIKELIFPMEQLNNRAFKKRILLL